MHLLFRWEQRSHLDERALENTQGTLSSSSRRFAHQRQQTQLRVGGVAAGDAAADDIVVVAAAASWIELVVGRKEPPGEDPPYIGPVLCPQRSRGGPIRGRALLLPACSIGLNGLASYCSPTARRWFGGLN